MTSVTQIPLSRLGDKPHTGLAIWFIEAHPQPHPIWRHYVLNVISLAEHPDFPPARKSSPEMTHEIQLIALDPETEPTPDDISTFRWLMPINYVRQFAASSDDVAIEVTASFARSLQNGRCFLETQGIMGAADWNNRCIDSVLEQLEIGSMTESEEK